VGILFFIVSSCLFSSSMFQLSFGFRVASLTLITLSPSLIKIGIPIFEELFIEFPPEPFALVALVESRPPSLVGLVECWPSSLVESWPPSLVALVEGWPAFG
jgi:hypothetical protein